MCLGFENLDRIAREIDALAHKLHRFTVGTSASCDGRMVDLFETQEARARLRGDGFEAGRLAAARKIYIHDLRQDPNHVKWREERWGGVFPEVMEVRQSLADY